VTGRAVVCAGSAAHSLGILARLAAGHTEAERHFEHALAMNTQLGARPFAAYTRYEYASMLFARGDAVDRPRARELLGQARDTAMELGMGLLLERVERLERAESARAAAVPATRDRSAASETARQHAVFRKEAHGWTIAYEGTSFRVKDSKGLGYVATLLRHPGVEFHALDLIAGDHASESGEPSDLSVRRDLGDAGELLDRKARSAYKQRLHDLRERLEEAKALGAADAATHVEEEIDFLTRELSRAVGLGNRERRAGSVAERARLNVTRAIKAAEEMITALNPLLGGHLRSTIRTGTFCVYQPDPGDRVSWTF
jgi:hypothetical protein